MNKDIIKQIDEMKLKRGPEYRPRTRHLNPDGSAQFTNRLFLETSPYLNQHAHNPVNWYPWGEEAFRKAQENNLPILVSIGYSTCHWCHVMEEESFEDLEIAEYLNKNFVTVKIDREERPDIDSVYMKAVQAMGLNGGWPLNVFVTPDLKPFYGGTYFPARDGDRGASTGFLTIVQKLKLYYTENPDKVEESGNALAGFLNQLSEADLPDDIPGPELLDQVLSTHINLYDPENGGMQGAPKFPSSLPVSLLFRQYKRTGNKKTLEMALMTLDKMRQGGIYDQVGGGFHRYTVDSIWLVPHFEKMLYDNALLAVNYTEAYQLTGEKKYRETVFHILDYIIRDMTSPQGGFYSATDADSLNPEKEYEEGYYFTWSPEEIHQALEKDLADLIIRIYNVRPGGNFEGRNILNLSQPLGVYAEKNELKRDDLVQKLEQAHDQLLQTRNRRPLPIRDEKIITAWNGLMISAFAKASFVFNEKRYLEVAVKSAGFILNHRSETGRLFRSFKDGRTKHDGFLEDYSFFTASLIDLFEASSDISWLKYALEFQEMTDKLFKDRDKGGYFMSEETQNDLLTREKPGTDGAVPSGNSVALMNLQRLGEYTLNDTFRESSVNLIKYFSGALKKNPVSYSEMLLAFDFFHGTPKEIIVLLHDDDDGNEFKHVLRKQYLPNRTLVFLTEDQVSDLSETLPLIKEKTAIDEKTTAYVCVKGLCRLPVQNSDDFRSELLN